MAKDPSSGPVSNPEGGVYPSSEEVRAADAAKAAGTPEETGEGLTRSEIINTFGEALGRKLLNGGFASLLSIQQASNNQLLAVAGVGPAAVKTIREKVGVVEVDADEPAIPELANLDEGEPVGAGVAGGVDPRDIVPAPVEVGFGEEGAMSPRIARAKAAADAQAEEEARIKDVIRASEEAAAPTPPDPGLPSDEPVDPQGPEMVELEAEIEVSEDDALDEQFIEEQLDDETTEDDSPEE